MPQNCGIKGQIGYISIALTLDKSANGCTLQETKVHQWQIDELMDKGFVKESMSPYSVRTLVVPKKDATFHMCVDGRAINDITIKYKHHIPRPDDMLDECYGSSIFSEVNLRSSYYQIQMKKDMNRTQLARQKVAFINS